MHGGVLDARLRRPRTFLSPSPPSGHEFHSVLETRLVAAGMRSVPVAVELLRPVAASPVAPAPTVPAGGGTHIAVGLVQRLDQVDPSQYDSLTVARRWGPASCSAASLAAVIRGTGRTVTVGDVVHALEARQGITTTQGLVSRPALVATARQYGFAAEDRRLTYDQLAGATASHPVLVDITNRTFPDGHWLVVTGAEGNGLAVVDSSGYRLTRLARADFEAAWGGRGIVLSPFASVAPATRETRA